jgi:hypothetical protein
MICCSKSPWDRESPPSLNTAATGEPVLSSMVGGQPQSGPPLKWLHPPDSQSPLPARFHKIYFRRHRRVQPADPGAGADAVVAPAGAVQQASPPGMLAAGNVPIAGSITPMQQSFLDQVTKKIGSVLPAPRINKRRAKGPSGSQPRHSRRIVGIPTGQGQPGLSQPKKEVMRALGFAQAQEQISQQNLDRYSKLFLQPPPPPLRFSRLQRSSAGWWQRSSELPLPWSFLFSFSMDPARILFWNV